MESPVQLGSPQGLLTLARAAHRLFVEKRTEIVLGPVADDLNEAMYMNRCSELGWMILRLLPYMRRTETPQDDAWDNKWRLLDDSFKMMADGLAGLGKKIAPAMIEFIEKKFPFDGKTYYSEPT
jgi:hypothetical protein